jgi:hypothetical protein
MSVRDRRPDDGEQDRTTPVLGKVRGVSVSKVEMTVTRPNTQHSEER